MWVLSDRAMLKALREIAVAEAPESRKEQNKIIARNAKILVKYTSK